MKPLQSLPWHDPLELAATLDEAYWVLLYSGAQASYSGRYSYLAYHLRETVSEKDMGTLATKLTHNRLALDNAWFGYLGYGLKNSLETLTADDAGWISLPNLYMMRFGTVIRFDHQERAVEVWSDNSSFSFPPIKGIAVAIPPVTRISSNMTRQQYLDNIRIIIDKIYAGELYQANLTRKFSGEFAVPCNPFAVFCRLAQVSPAPYSAFLKLGEYAVASSSPELFLHIDNKGRMRTRPIKGTAPRFNDPIQDRQSYETLAVSAKDRAENLMIVDLMRNDFSRSCVPGSVATSGLFEVTSHTAVHHMSSTVTGQKHPDCKTLDAIARCFPPGSMTGAPKIHAMNLCSQLERKARGVYSGAIGWLGGDGSCEFSVVIRTLVLRGRFFEFQVGGAIVSDSKPETELMETIDKSKGIMAALGISIDDMPF